ncbi:MAG: hypothetical protein K2P51_00665 [Rhabdochlamydiaceae bacterium]|nr:hypothetical protein [Rhabdochlamydiaceae bacterium]
MSATGPVKINDEFSAYFPNGKPPSVQELSHQLCVDLWQKVEQIRERVINESLQASGSALLQTTSNQLHPSVKIYEETKL